MATRKTTREAETVLPATSPLPDIQVSLTQPYGPGFDYWELHAVATGVTPLLQHNPASMWEGRGVGASTRGKNIPTPEDEARQGAYILPTGQLYMPALALRNCFLEGCSRGDFRVGRKPLKVPLASGLIIPGEKLPLTRGSAPIMETDYEISQMRAVIQRAGIIRSRPRIAEGWEIAFTVLVDAALYRQSQALAQIWELFNFAGHTVGIGDYRPARLGTYGQFKVAIAELAPLYEQLRG